MTESTKDSRHYLLVDGRRARELLCVGKTKFYELIARDDFPKPRNVPGIRKHMWLYTDVEAWASRATDNQVGNIVGKDAA